MPKATVKLIVTGDDFGYCPRRNQGIVECFLAGAVSNVSLLVNGSAVSDAVQLAKSSLHLPDGRAGPLSGCSSSPQLDFLNICFLLFFLPEIRHIFAQVLKDYGITYTRIPIEPDLPRCDWIDPPLMAFYQGVEKDSLNTVAVFRKHSIRWPDIYIGLSTMGKNMSVTNIRGAIDNATTSYLAKVGDSSTLPSSSVSPDQETRTVTIELMTHPGYPSIPPVGGCGEGPDDFSQSWERQHELETLKNTELQNHYKTRNIELCAFKDLGL
nr:carbohydrate deacetylase [Pogona vitticeps]